MRMAYPPQFVELHLNINKNSEYLVNTESIYINIYIYIYRTLRDYWQNIHCVYLEKFTSAVREAYGTQLTVSLKSLSTKLL